VEVVGKFLLFGGFLLTIGCQLYIAVLAFRRKFIEGLLCCVVPAYILFWAKREKTRQATVLFMWGLGIVVFIAGVVLLSSLV
jgi:hypothetical protein